MGLGAVSAQHIKLGPTGCLVEHSAQVADDITCGGKSTVVFGVEWYGSDRSQLQSWLEVAGCTEDEAREEALRAADRCQSGSKPAAAAAEEEDEIQKDEEGVGNIELRGLRHRVRRFA